MDRPKLAFEINDSKGMLSKLQEDYKDFDNEHLNSRFAMNCVFTAWHLSDWTYHEFFKNDLRFQDEEIQTNKGPFSKTGLSK